MLERVLVVVGLAGAILVALALTGALQQPTLPGAGASQYCPTDQYGNQYADCFDDSTPPLISSIVTPGPNDNGWNNTNVTLIFSADDEQGGTGVRSINCNLGGTTDGSTRGIVFTQSTLNTTVTCTAMDWAGNVSAPVSKTVRIDKVRPSIALLSRTPPADPYGWNDSDVTVVWACADSFSGPVSPTFSRTVATNGASQLAAGTCTDLAGNAITNTLGNINIDKAAIPPVGGPPNDNIVNATTVPSLPFTDATADTTNATREAHEPSCFFPAEDRTVWYRLSPSQSGFVRVGVSGSFGAALPSISVWRASPTGLQLTSCGPSTASSFNAQAGVTYYVKISNQGVGTGPFTVDIESVPAPPNDAFENATPVDSLPFSAPLDLTAATTQAGEPLRPGGPFTSPLVTSAWYRYTPPHDETLVLGGTGPAQGGRVLAVYTGSALANLTLVGSNSGLFPAGNTSFFAPVIFTASAGTTYFFQVGGTFASPSGDGGLTVGVDKAIAYGGQTPAANAEGWNNTDVTLTWHCSPLIPFSQPTITQALTADGVNQSATASCTSPVPPFQAATDTESGIDIDRTPPTISFDGQTPPPNANATGTFLSLDSAPGDYIGGGTTQLYSSVDSTFAPSLAAGGDYFSAFVNEGNFSHWWYVNIAAPPGEPLSVGHYSDAVRAEFRPPGVPGLDVFGDGRGCNQVAGSFDVNELSFTSTGELLTFDATFEQHCEIFGPPLVGRIRIDNRDPSAPPSLGWNNTDVRFGWSCADSLSGATAPSVSTTLSSEGGMQPVEGTCFDLAGNDSTDTRHGSVDKTSPNAPTASAGRPPDYAGGGGWFKDSVAVSFSDQGDPEGSNGTPGSGVDPGSVPGPVTFDTEGSHTATGTVQDLAGNESAEAALTVQVDTTPPELSATFTNADGSTYTPGTWTNQAVTATFHCTDGSGSGVATFSAPQTVLIQGVNQFVVGNCSDNVGHTTTRSFGGIDIDLTPPEASFALDPATGDLRVVGTDQGGSGVPAGPVVPSSAPGKGNGQTRTYTVTDRAGNTLVLVLQAKAVVGALQATVTSLRYNGAAAIAAPFTRFGYDWSTSKDGSLKALDQDLTVGTGSSQRHVLASWDAGKNQTKIIDGGSTTTRAGLVLVRVASNAGALVIDF